MNINEDDTAGTFIACFIVLLVFVYFMFSLKYGHDEYNARLAEEVKEQQFKEQLFADCVKEREKTTNFYPCRP